MPAEPPIVVGPFIVPESTVDGHRVRLIVESARPGHLGRSEGQDVRRPWLRAACSCGWVSQQRFGIEDNAWNDWRGHVELALQGRALLRPGGA